MSNKYKVWACKIVISGDCELPSGFDSPPRMAVEKAIEDAGFEVLMNSSGWGGNLEEHEFNTLESGKKRQNIYVAGSLETEGFIKTVRDKLDKN